MNILINSRWTFPIRIVKPRKKYSLIRTDALLTSYTTVWKTFLVTYVNNRMARSHVQGRATETELQFKRASYFGAQKYLNWSPDVRQEQNCNSMERSILGHKSI